MKKTLVLRIFSGSAAVILLLAVGVMLFAPPLMPKRNIEEKAVIDRTIDVHIRNLREKLGGAGSLIKNIRGVGYKLEE